MTMEIRDAEPGDAGFVGWVMLTALDIPADSRFNKPEVWKREDILYSWTRTRVAVIDGRPVGALISYPGEEYARLRIHTWELIFGQPEEPEADAKLDAGTDSHSEKDTDTGAETTDIDADAGPDTEPTVSADAKPRTIEEEALMYDLETFPGEYYLDSLAVLPEFRGQGIGRALLLDGVAKGRQAGFERVTLIVDVDKPKNITLYESLGFVRDETISFFGHQYYRMHFAWR